MTKLFDQDYTIDAGEYFFLDDIFNQARYSHIYGKMMDTRRNRVSFLNKGMCGNGGTTGYIRYAKSHNKGLLILVPYVSICKSKEDGDVCCIYEGCNKFDRDSQIIVATYDQYPRLLRELNMGGGLVNNDDMWGDKFWSGRTIIIDEYDKMMDESGFRDICKKMTELITKTQSPVVLMSATPDNNYVQLVRKLMPEREIFNYSVQYDKEYHNYDTRVDVWDTKFKDLKDILYTMLNSSNNKHICVFYNSVNDIRDILDKLNDNRCEILCSKTRDGDCGKYYSDKFSEDKKLHFMTSAYFVGHDINIYIDQVVIVGSCEFERMCLSPDDIKQIIGRFRYDISIGVNGGVRHSGVHLWYMKKKKDQKNYLKYLNIINKSEQVIKVMDMLKDNWKEYPDHIGEMMTYYRTKDTLDMFKMWETRKGVEEGLNKYGFIVKYRGDIKDYLNIGKKKHITFKQAKDRVRKGEKVTFEEYPDINELITFKNVKGASALSKNDHTKSYIHNWYKVWSKVKDVSVKDDDMFKTLGLENFGRYNAKYLKACLEYIGINGTYDTISIDMLEYLKCYAVVWCLDEKKRKNNTTYLLIRVLNFSRNRGDFLLSSVNIYNSKISPISGKILNPKDIMKIGLVYNRKPQITAKTIRFDEAIKEFANLKGRPTYDLVMEDKKNRLTKDVKDSKEWQNMKKYDQTMIGDMYSEEKTYRYTRSEVYLADSLIIDIDDGLRFSEFQEKYKDWGWFAYPTLNNTEDDWKKFRVVIPLEHTINLGKGEHNLKVMKMLRSFFCPYEDQSHQLFSYININDFVNCRKNNGQLYNIPQDFVDSLIIAVENSYDYNSKKFNKEEVGEIVSSMPDMTLEGAQRYFEKCMASSEDGARHYGLYKIKKSLSPDDRKKFREWLVCNYPSKYAGKWDGHKV